MALLGVLLKYQWNIKAKTCALLAMLFALNGCVVVPVKSIEQVQTCKLSSDKKTLQIVDVAKETNTYYSVSGVLLSPILVPTTAIISGAYVVVNNTYHLGEKTIKCDD